MAQCATCHKLDRSGGPTHGPTLYDVIGRPRASAPGFDHYSPAMRRLGGVWSEEALNVFLAHPVMAVPGTTMVTDGVADPRERAHLIAFLRTLDDKAPPEAR